MEKVQNADMKHIDKGIIYSRNSLKSNWAKQHIVPIVGVN